MGPAFQYSFAATVGASYVGTILASILYGMTSIQTLTFFRFHRRNRLWIQITVAFLWVLDTIHLAFIGHAVYTYVITDFGDMDAIAQPLWSITAHVLISNISDLIVRGVFSYRIWILSANHCWRTVTVSLASLVVFVSGFGKSRGGASSTSN
ncbi:uncharacterized protein C8Q71DRAFT_778659 [Rhodofomes roseus]|uniref:Uncharacterized protein n=1 Tax=Rhodofomes roseus TaxID=34475 RepID=A0ABQ8K4P8_9APHY|nr:uncharacterized protein C8Q71DRAFT_778659 [Rhodofomes roseus]KAH9831930.1 hypothetical protein C8Q71DRAFT_778659 [Rhodofomes roseus]